MADDDRGYMDSPDAYHKVRSRTPADRRAERDARDAARLAATTKGADGVQVKQNTIGLDSSAIPAPSGQQNFGPVLVTVNVSGEAMVMLVMGSTPTDV